MPVSQKPDGFARALQQVLVYEGGNSDNKLDPGGRTRQGVIQRVYDAWRKGHGQPVQDVFKMSDSERDAIYRSQYWNAIQGDLLPPGVDFVVFDGAVNSGPIQAIKWLQRALGVTADGQLGMVTFGALTANTNHAALVDAIVDRREAYLHALSTFPIYGKGWLNRTSKVRALGKNLARGFDKGTPVSVAPIPPSPAPVTTTASPKADIADATKAPSKGVADAATGAGVGAAGLGGTIQTLQEQLTPFSMAGGWISKLVVVLIVVGAVLTIGGLAYRWWAQRQKAKVADVLDTPTVSA